jgi:hypothetical protein
MVITEPPVTGLAYKIEHHPQGVGFEPSVNGEITRATPFFFKFKKKKQ